MCACGSFILLNEGTNADIDAYFVAEHVINWMIATTTIYHHLTELLLRKAIIICKYFGSGNAAVKIHTKQIIKKLLSSENTLTDHSQTNATAIGLVQ